MSEEVWHEVMNNTGEDKDNLLISFTEYMELLSEKDPEFVYEILEDTNGQITGCLWMTSTMRENFDLFGGYVCVDAMKRGINTLLWPYIATTMYNELESVCVGCEGIVTGERVGAYRALLDFQVRNSSRKKEEIYGLSVDGFLLQEVLNIMGFQSTRFVMDYFHLFDSVLPKRFGHDGFNILKDCLRNMAHANDDLQFDLAYGDALAILSARRRNQRWENELSKFYSERDVNARYKIQQIRGTRGRRGSSRSEINRSSCSEINHSSVLINLNEDQRSVQKYCEHPITLIKDLFARQLSHIKKWNNSLFDEGNKLKVELDRLREMVLKRIDN